MIETPPEALKEINDIIQNFIWEGKTPKIAQNILVMNIDEGGLKLYLYSTKVDALTYLGLKDCVIIEKPTEKTIPKLFYNCYTFLQTIHYSIIKIISRHSTNTSIIFL